jgi:hypothetical protein
MGHEPSFSWFIPYPDANSFLFPVVTPKKLDKKVPVLILAWVLAVEPANAPQIR